MKRWNFAMIKKSHKILTVVIFILTTTLATTTIAETSNERWQKLVESTIPPNISYNGFALQSLPSTYKEVSVKDSSGSVNKYAVYQPLLENGGCFYYNFSQKPTVALSCFSNANNMGWVSCNGSIGICHNNETNTYYLLTDDNNQGYQNSVFQGYPLIPSHQINCNLYPHHRYCKPYNHTKPTPVPPPINNEKKDKTNPHQWLDDGNKTNPHQWLNK